MGRDRLIIIISVLLLFILFLNGVKAQDISLALNMNIVKNQIILPEPLLVKMELFKIGSSERQDIIINKIIEDSKNKLVFSNQKTIAIETSVSFVDTVDLQKDLAPGIYTLNVSINYDNRTVSETETFEIVKERFRINILTVLGALIIIFFIVLIVVVLKRLRETNKLISKLYKSKDFKKNIRGTFI